jgi:pimeloyl-ACP methyl ester carboxylesterase
VTTATSHTERTVSVRDGAFNIEVREGGEGPPLLYMHNMMAEFDWFPFMERLAENHRVIAPIFPGFRESTGLEHIDDPTDTVVYHNDLLDALGVDSAIVMGHELGGMFAAEFAALSPQRVEKLVLIDAYGLWIEETPVPDYFATPRRDLPGLMWHDPSSEIAQNYNPPTRDPEINIQRTRAQTSGSRFLWQFPDRGLSKRIHRVKAPTLIVWGEDDGQIPPAYAELFHSMIAGSEVAMIKDAGNLPQIEQVDAFMEAVNRFLG